MGAAGPAADGVLTHALQAALYAAAAWLGYGLLSGERGEDGEEEDGREPCPRCHGTGRVECFCHRWSDGDAGCASCGGTGECSCSTCGGGGTGIPVPVRVPLTEAVNNPRRY